MFSARIMLDGCVLTVMSSLCRVCLWLKEMNEGAAGSRGRAKMVEGDPELSAVTPGFMLVDGTLWHEVIHTPSNILWRLNDTHLITVS